MTVGYKRLCGFYDHPNADKYGVILEHRLVMSQKLGRPLKKNETVHHINDDTFDDTFDNRPENLEIYTNEEHARKHALERGKLVIEIECNFCGSTFELDLSQYNSKVKQGYKNFYCNRSCMGKGQWNKHLFKNKKQADVV